MECRACAVVNDPGRRYCRACGGRLGQPCGSCNFFNALDDRHCGGCGRRLPAARTDATASRACAAAAVGERGRIAGGRTAPATAGVGASPSGIDGLFESILDEEPGEGAG